MTTNNWIRVCSVDDVPAGEMVGKEIPGAHVAVYNVDGTYFATDNICTHAYALLTEGWLDEGVIECPLHGGQFDIQTGKALTSPAECDLRTYPVRVTDGFVEVMISSA